MMKEYWKNTADEELRQKLKEDADKKKEQEAMLKNAAKSKKNLEENEMFEQEGRSLMKFLILLKECLTKQQQA